MSEEKTKTDEGGLGGLVSAVLIIFGVTVGVLFLFCNPQLVYAGHEAKCVEPDGTVVVRMEYNYPDGAENPERTSMAKAGETSPRGYSIVSVDEPAPGRYSVALLVTGQEKPRVFEVPACSAETR